MHKQFVCGCAYNYTLVAQRVGESKVPVVALYTLDTVSTQDFLCAIKYITPVVFNLFLAACVYLEARKCS